MVHGTKLACDLARHLPIHRPGDSAAPRGDIGRGALRERSKAPKLRHIVARNAPLRAGALVAHEQPVRRRQCRCLLVDGEPGAVRLGARGAAAHQVWAKALVDVEELGDSARARQSRQRGEVELRAGEICALALLCTEEGMVHHCELGFREQYLHCAES